MYLSRSFLVISVLLSTMIQAGCRKANLPQLEKTKEESTNASTSSNFNLPQRGEITNYIKLAEKLIPSVVNISTLTTLSDGPMFHGTPDEFMRKFFEEFMSQDAGPQGHSGRPGGRPKGAMPHALPKAIALGTGFVINEDGDILTNYHVVAKADEIKVSFTEEAHEEPTPAEVIGRDPDLDIALIRVKNKAPTKLAPVVFGDSDKVAIGEYVMAVGNPFGQGHSVTHGIVSQKGRAAPDFPLANYMQTDAPINPGNSGGPLINLRGEVIAVNNAIDPRGQGIGFAIPINVVKAVLPQMKSKGVVTRGYIGVAVEEVNDAMAKELKVSKDLKATVVIQVNEGSPADRAGLRPYDVIISYNKEPIETSTELIGKVSNSQAGKSVPVQIVRNGKEMNLSLRLAKRPLPVELATEIKSHNARGGRSIASIQNKNTPPVLGMTVSNLNPHVAAQLGLKRSQQGVVISTLDFGGPAALAGLRVGDVIQDVNGSSVESATKFYAMLNERRPYKLQVRRPNPNDSDVFLGIVLDLEEQS